MCRDQSHGIMAPNRWHRLISMTTAQPPTSTDGQARRRLSWRRKAAYLAVIWFIALFLLEGTLRVVQPQFVTFVGDFLAVHEYVCWHNTDLRPNVSRRLRLSTSNNLSLLDMTITTDQWGLRTNDPIAYTHNSIRRRHGIAVDENDPLHRRFVHDGMGRRVRASVPRPARPTAG